jgi:hypothetical protein
MCRCATSCRSCSATASSQPTTDGARAPRAHPSCRRPLIVGSLRRVTAPVGLRPAAGVRLVFRTPPVEPIGYLAFQDHLAGARDFIAICCALRSSAPAPLVLERFPEIAARAPIFASRRQYQRFRDSVQEGLFIVSLRYESPIEIVIGFSYALVTASASAAFIAEQARYIFEQYSAIRLRAASTDRDVSRLRLEQLAYEQLARGLRQSDEKTMKRQLQSAARVLAELNSVD